MVCEHGACANETLHEPSSPEVMLPLPTSKGPGVLAIFPQAFAESAWKADGDEPAASPRERVRPPDSFPREPLRPGQGRGTSAKNDMGVEAAAN